MLSRLGAEGLRFLQAADLGGFSAIALAALPGAAAAEAVNRRCLAWR